MAISTTVKGIQDIMRKDAGVDGDAQRISQLVWMLFLKVFDDREQEKELLEDGYKSPIPKRLRWSTWAAIPKGITGDALLDFVNGDLFKTLKELPVNGKNAALSGVVRSVFEDAYNYMKSGTLMRQVINKLNEVDFNRQADRHEFGEVYEKILSDLQNAGNAGEFYTPRAVTQFIVDQVDPKLGERLLDPACGTGGFLVCAIEHVRKKYVKSANDEALLQAAIAGVEKKPLPHLLCTTNMIFHGIDVPSQIRHDNTLARPLRDYGPKDRVDVVVTNPPFGGMEEDGIEQNFPQSFRTRETADLFLLLIVTLLKPGGRGALVLPDGTLFGTDGVKARLKEKLLEECNLHTIVRLPKGVFSPYTSIKTNLLFFTKGEPTKDVWFYEHPYPDGYKSYSKTKPMRIEEFAPEKKWWGKRKETNQAWKVSIDGRRSVFDTQYSTNGAFDGSALFEPDSDSLVIAGENGLLYTVKLNTEFYSSAGRLSLDPRTVTLKSKAAGENASLVSVEGSVAMYGKYAYLADAYGFLRCVDTDTMRTVWSADAGDNTDATPALGFDPDGSLGLYTGTTRFTRLAKEEYAVIRRLDALTGKEVWSRQVTVQYNSRQQAGVVASPVIGQHAISDRVIFTVNCAGSGSLVLALDKLSGELLWSVQLEARAVSSPVAIYNEEGDAWLVQADMDGSLHLMDPLSGETLSSLSLGGEIKASPAVFDDMLVIGTGGQSNAKVYGIRLR